MTVAVRTENPIAAKPVSLQFERPAAQNKEKAIDAWIFFKVMSKIKELIGDIQVDEAKSLHEFYIIADRVNDQLLDEQLEMVDKYVELKEKIAKVEVFQKWANVAMGISLAAMIISPMIAGGIFAAKIGVAGKIVKALPIATKALSIGGGIAGGILYIITGSLQISVAETLKEKAELEEKVNVNEAVRESSETTKEYVQGMLRDVVKQRAEMQAALTQLIDSLREAYKAIFK